MRRPLDETAISTFRTRPPPSQPTSRHVTDLLQPVSPTPPIDRTSPVRCVRSDRCLRQTAAGQQTWCRPCAPVARPPGVVAARLFCRAPRRRPTPPPGPPPTTLSALGRALA